MLDIRIDGKSTAKTIFIHLVAYEEGRILLQELMTDANFKNNFLTHIHFINSLLSIVPESHYRNLSPLFLLTTSETGISIIEKSIPTFSKNLPRYNLKKFIAVLLSEVPRWRYQSPMSNLDSTPRGRAILENLMQYPNFKNELNRQLQSRWQSSVHAVRFFACQLLDDQCDRSANPNNGLYG